MSRQLQVSVIIPTFNRAKYLGECLEAVAAQTADPTTYEVIIVDNNSTDNTQDACLKFIQMHPNLHIRYV
ncbi:MAG: glycosyltransferase family 2 protein [Anaerolineales bacterium]|nr:glycosyltransferase family 2 protein [Anaerolineales bacterium]